MRFWDAKMDAKIDFLEVFFRCFFECVLASIFGRFFHVFLRADLENSCAHAVFRRLLHSFAYFEKSEKKQSNLESFSEAKTAKNQERMVLKNICFFNFVFFMFF